MAKYIDMNYAAPAIVGVSFTVRADKWNEMDDADKAEYVRKELCHANSVMADNEGTSAYITNTAVELAKLEMDEEYEFEGEGEWE